MQRYNGLSTSQLDKKEKLSIKLKNTHLNITFLSNCKVLNIIAKFLSFNFRMMVTQDLSQNGC